MPGESFMEPVNNARVLDPPIRKQQAPPTAPTPGRRDHPTIWLSQRGLITSVSSFKKTISSSSTMATAVLLTAA